MCRQILSLLVRALVLCCFVEVAVACTCLDSPSPCASFKETPIVFVGLVTSIEEDKVDIVHFGEKRNVRTGLLAHFTVEEPLKGIDLKTVDVATGGGGGDCGYPFKAGKRYIVYAYKSSGDALSSSMSRTVIGGRSGMAAPLSANICSRTRPLESATDDVVLIRALKNGKPETRVFGSVSEYAQKLGTYEYNIDRVRPMPGLKVKAENANNRYEATTDQIGRYKISDLKPGRYRLTVVLPEGYGPLWTFMPMSVNVDITPEACLEFDFDAQVDGRISGHIYDADGRPVNDQVQVSIVTVESSAKGIALVESRSEYTKNKGWYEFDGLLPGQYLLGISIADVPAKHSPYSRLYYPNTSERTQARVFNLATGQKLTGIDFHLPPKLPEVTFSGIVVDAEGRPVVEADVDIYDQENPRELVFGYDVKTDKEGRFTIRLFKGRQYRLHAWKDENYFAGTGQQSELVDIDANAETPPLKLILNKAGIFLKKQN